MEKTMRALLLVPLLFVLATCAPISEEACRGGDWQGIGFADGTKGKLLSVFDSYQETCAEYGTVPVKQAYLAGRAMGLLQYCTPQNAYSVGRSGDALSPVCAAPQVTAMRPAYAHGQSYYEYEQDIRQAEDRIDELRRELAQISANPAPTQADTSRAAIILSRIRDYQFDIRRFERRQQRYASWP